MTLFLSGPAGKLEAVLWEPRGDARAAAVVCHPHPLGSGTMNTTAVYRTARGLQEAGFVVLRFNFRGTGRSEGEHDGNGAEEGDLVAALDWLAAERPDLELWGAGFSFGARTVASRARTEKRMQRIVLVALPVRAYDCSFLKEVETPGVLFMASDDEFGTLAELREQFPELDPRLEAFEIRNTDHFFQNASRELQARVREYAEQWVAESAG